MLLLWSVFQQFPYHERKDPSYTYLDASHRYSGRIFVYLTCNTKPFIMPDPGAGVVDVLPLLYFSVVFYFVDSLDYAAYFSTQSAENSI